MVQRVISLAERERPQTASAQENAAAFTLNMLKEDRFEGAEILRFPADGKTAFHDKIMPLLWEISEGKLVSDSGGEVFADYKQNSFSVAAGSTSLPPEGLHTRVITEAQLLAGEDPRGAFVLFSPSTSPTSKVLRPVLDMGAVGFVSDYLAGRYESPDDCQWINGCSDSGDWHATLDDRPFVGFSITPRSGMKLRSLAERGSCAVCAFSDGRRFSGTLPVVTAVVPGRRKREFWLIAHLYEPLPNDDSTGVAAAIEAAKMIRETTMPEYTIRLLFAHELYGYAAYAASRGTNLRNQVVGGCNLDDISSVKPGKLMLVPSGESVPFHGNEILKDVYDELRDVSLELHLQSPEYYDDLALSDSTVGVPMTWLMGKGRFWHNSAQCNPDNLDPEIFFNAVALASAYIHAVVTTPAESLPVPRTPAVTKKSTPWRNYAGGTVFSRLTAGFPFSLAKIPVGKRKSLPDNVLYGPFASILSRMDGKKDFGRILLETEEERKISLSDDQIRKYFNALNYLERNGYLKAENRPELTDEDIADALKRLGIKKTDVLLVHSSATKCGFISGGAETILRSLRATAGTALFTTFTNSYIYLGGTNKHWSYRPFSKDNLSAIWTGGTGRHLLEHHPEAVRSRHITHSWAGFGELAHECLDPHGPTDPPCGETSPLAKALERGGKVLYFGTGLAPSTFLHFLEDQCNVPYLDTAVCRVREADGSLRTVLIEKHLPGHRDFYTPDAENRKFFTRAVAEGLEIKKVLLGMGALQLIDLKNFYEVGMKLLKKEPDILLCDSEKCPFCSRFGKHS